MSASRAGLIGMLIFAVSLQSGCSFLFVKGPPAEHAQMATFDCSESNALPVLDAIWAGLNGIGAAAAASDDQNPNQGQIVGVGLAWLALSGISAIYGFTKVSECNDAKRQRDERYYPAGLPPRPPTWAPASTPMAPSGPAPAPAPAPAATPPPAAAPAPAAPGTAPSSTPGSATPAPKASRAPSRLVLPTHLAVRSSPPRSLTMRPALAAD